MKYTIDDWLPYKDMMIQIAGEFGRRYPMVAVDDLQQEMYLWFVTHPRKFKEWLDLDEKDRSKLLAKSLRNQCLKFCEKEKARTLGYELTDLYYYDTSVIETFLPSIITESYEMPVKAKNLGLKTGKQEIQDGMNWLALRADIAKGYYNLSEAKQEILKIRFANENADWKEIAEQLKTTPDGARMKVRRAINSIIQHIGGLKFFNDKDTETTDTPEPEPEEDTSEE